MLMVGAWLAFAGILHCAAWCVTKQRPD
jgi:hypothetical protein